MEEVKNNNTPEIPENELNVVMPVVPGSIKELRTKRSNLYHRIRYYQLKGVSKPELENQLKAVREAIKNYPTK